MDLGPKDPLNKLQNEPQAVVSGKDLEVNLADLTEEELDAVSLWDFKRENFVSMNPRQIFYCIQMLKRTRDVYEKFEKHVGSKKAKLAYGISSYEIESLLTDLRKRHKDNIKAFDDERKKQIP